MADNGVALVLIDVLEAFFTPGRPAYYPDSAKVIDPLRELLAKAREQERLIVHAVERPEVVVVVGDTMSVLVPLAGMPPTVSRSFPAVETLI